MHQWDMPHQHEPRTLTLADGHPYTPDFYLPRQNAWLEVKGRGDHLMDRPMLLAQFDPTIDVFVMRFRGRRPLFTLLTGYTHPRAPELPALGSRCPDCELAVLVEEWQQFCPACHTTTRDPHWLEWAMDLGGQP